MSYILTNHYVSTWSKNNAGDKNISSVWRPLYFGFSEKNNTLKPNFDESVIDETNLQTG